MGRGGRAGLAAQSAGIAPAGVPAGLYPVRTSGRMGLFAKGTHWCEGGQMPSGRELGIAAIVRRRHTGYSREDETVGRGRQPRGL